MRNVALVGAGVSKFGVRKASYRDLIWEAGKACFDSAPGVRPRDLRIGEERRKGYALEDLCDPISRYTPRSRPETARQPNGSGASGDFPTRDTPATVAAAKPEQAPMFPGVVALSRMAEAVSPALEVFEV